jgi:hypothetical protein
MLSAQTQTEKFTPPFKRLNQKELLDCLQHGWTGRATFVKAAVEPPTGSGKYARLAYSMANKKAFVSAIVVPNDKQDYHYRMVNYGVVAALEKKGLVTVTFTSEYEAVFSLSETEHTDEAREHKEKYDRRIEHRHDISRSLEGC